MDEKVCLWPCGNWCYVQEIEAVMYTFSIGDDCESMNYKQLTTAATRLDVILVYIGEQ